MLFCFSPFFGELPAEIAAYQPKDYDLSLSCLFELFVRLTENFDLPGLVLIVIWQGDTFSPVAFYSERFISFKSKSNYYLLSLSFDSESSFDNSY